MGEENSSTGTELQEDSTGKEPEARFISYSHGTSINYLTGVAKRWRVQAPSSSTAPYKDDFDRIKHGKKRIEKLVHLSSPPQIVSLDGFDPFAETHIQDKLPSGYFDQHFNYHEVP